MSPDFRNNMIIWKVSRFRPLVLLEQQHVADGHSKWDLCCLGTGFSTSISVPETSVRNYHYSLRNNPEERSYHPLHGGGLKLRTVATCPIYPLLTWWCGFAKTPLDQSEASWNQLCSFSLLLLLLLRWSAWQQWRTQEFFSGWGGSTNSVEDRENGDLGGGRPLVRGSGGSCNLVQEISFHMVKFS